MERIIAALLPVLLRSISKQLRKSMIEFLKTLEKQAAQTDNPFDDMLIAVLRETFRE